MAVVTDNPGDTRPKPPRIEAVSDLVLIAGELPPKTVIIPGGDRADDLRLVESARDHGIVDRCILVGDEQAIRRAADEVAIRVADEDILATATAEQTAARTIERVLQGGVDVILKGNISTPILNRAMIRIATRDTMSLVTMFDAKPVAGGRPMLLTDPGVTTVCNFSRMVGLIDNAIDVAHAVMGIERPRVAILSANEKIIDSLPSTRMGAALTDLPWDNALVYGPLSFDLAVSEESVRLKESGLQGAALEVCGRADILVCPCLDSANILYKVLMETVKFGLGTFAGVTIGVAVPYVILSRADNVETKLLSIALSSIASERMDMGRRKAPSRRVVRPAPARNVRVLAVRPEAAATRVAVFENEQCLHLVNLPCQAAATADGPEAEARRRAAAIGEALQGPSVGPFDAVVAGGCLWPRADGWPAGGARQIAKIRGGDVVVDEQVAGAAAGAPADLGALMAAALARRFKVPAFVVTPTLDESFARQLGSGGETLRRGCGDLLSVWAAAARTADRMGLPAPRANYAVAHLAGEITVAAVRGGLLADSEAIRILGSSAASGSAADRLAELEERAASGNASEEAQAAVARIAKALGAMCVVAGPDAEAIILAGELGRFGQIARMIKGQVVHLLPVILVKQPCEMEVLAQAACGALSGEQAPGRAPAPEEP